MTAEQAEQPQSQQNYTESPEHSFSDLSNYDLLT